MLKTIITVLWNYSVNSSLIEIVSDMKEKIEASSSVSDGDMLKYTIL